MSAFVPTSFSLSSSSQSSSFFTPSVTPRPSSTCNLVAKRYGSHISPRATMSNNMSANSIDFSKVNISTAGSNFEGLVFTPETDNRAVKTRVDVGFLPSQESALNDHINVEYSASYAYHAIWAYFNRDTVALPGFAKYFLEQSEEERDHAHEFMTYQNKRGGQVDLQPVAVPELKFTMTDGTSDALYAMDMHLQLEKFVYAKLMHLHGVAEKANDPQMQDFVEHYLDHQLDAIKTAADYVSQIRRVGTPHGVYHLDLTLRGVGNAAGNGVA